MNKSQKGHAAILALMMLATVAVTAGVALVLFPAAERTPSFVLSLVALCFAEALLFAFPIYHARVAADRRQPSFVFGFGIQSALVLYAIGVVVLCFLSGVGTLSYSLEERAGYGEATRVQQARARGDGAQAGRFDGVQHTRLVTDRALPAGASDTFEIDATLSLSPGAAPEALGCASGALRTLSVLSGDAGHVQRGLCLRDATEVLRSGDLEIRKTLVEAPRVHAGASGVFDLRYRIEVHNTRWFTSFRTLAIAHAIWLLGLLLTSGVWRIGSNHAENVATTARVQRHDFAEVRGRFGAFAARVRLDRHPSMRAFAAMVDKLADDIGYATPETLPGTESHTGALLSALERLSAEYGRLRAKLGGDTPIDTELSALTEQVAALGLMVRERDAAVRAAR